MDLKHKSIKSVRKHTKEDMKMGGTTASNNLCTPPQTKYYRKPMSRKSGIIEDYEEICNTEEASPVLLSTQEGGRGCEVTWDWRSPNRNDRVLNTPENRIKRKISRKPKNVSPLLRLSSKRKLQKPSNMHFLDNLHAELAEIRQNFQSTEMTCSLHNTTQSTTNNNNKTRTEHQPSVDLSTCSPEKYDTSDISPFFRSHSLIDSRVAENLIDLNCADNNTSSMTNHTERINMNQDYIPEEFFFEDIPDHIDLCVLPNDKATNRLSKVEEITKICKGEYKSPNYSKLTVKSLCTPKNKCTNTNTTSCINDDSFDAIMSTFSDEVLELTDDTNLESKQERTNLCDVENVIPKPNSNKNIYQNIKTTSEAVQDNACSNVTSRNDQNYHSSADVKVGSKTGFIRHNSMPVSPRVLGSKFQAAGFGRHNSMPYNAGKKLNNDGQSSASDRTDSLESLRSISSSQLQCTPDEIEKKRQEALKKKEARRIRQEIERKRLEAIEKLKMKSKISADVPK